MEQKSRWASHLLILTTVVLVFVLAWRLTPDMRWWPSLHTEPLFTSEQEAVPEPEELADDVPQEETPAEPEPEEAPLTDEEMPLDENPDAAVQETEPVMSPEPDPEPIPDTPQPSAAPQQDLDVLFADWGQARRLLRLRDLAGAEAAYLVLQQRWPDHPDLSGELGNVYVLMGEQTLARAAFLQARQQLQPLGPSLQLRAVETWLQANP